MNAHDRRHIATGWEIPSEGYCDQPYVVVNPDGSWTVTMTTGAGHEGDSGQHVVAAISTDRGRTWSELIDIEPADGPEASWVMPVLIPETGRIYVFYTYNKANQRRVKTVDGGFFTRVDSFGVYAYKYSDDGGRSWSDDRFEIPMRLFDCDRENVYGGKVQFFWGVGKPFLHHGAVYVCASKVGGFGRGFFARNEGVLFRCSNLLTEHDPAKHEWETLPSGDVGLRTPEGGGPIAGEFNATPMNDGSLYGTYRTIDGWSCHAYSRDDGRTWERDWMTYTPGGRRVKNPRSANFVRRFSNGKYVYWFCFHGGEPLKRNIEECQLGYAHRNPIWLCGGVERDGRIHWSQPEIVLYDDKIGNRMSYPDFIEDHGRYFFTETQKTVARVHELDPALLTGMWQQNEDRDIVRDGLVLECARTKGPDGTRVAMPDLPMLHDRGGSRIDPETGATLPGGQVCVSARGGVTLEVWLRFAELESWQVIFDSRDAEGRGMLLQLTDRETLRLTLCGRAYDAPGSTFGNGLAESSHACDDGLLRPNTQHHVVFIVDGGPKLILCCVDGVLCDGGATRQFGWGRFHPNLKEVNGAATACIAPAICELRIYNRALRVAEAVANSCRGPAGCHGM